MEKYSLKSRKNYNQETPYYADSILPDCRFHHGQIPMLPGVECYQVVRANRNNPQEADNTSSTYKHAPDLTYFHGKFYIQYLCNPIDEHAGAGYSILASSSDGEHWEDFKQSFPTLRIPKCEITDYKNIKHIFTGEEYAFMHQRMCFYRSSSDRLLLLGFYGYSPEKWMTNWDNYGIGRVVRELYTDGSMSQIYFIMPCYQAGWDKQLLDKMYPMYNESLDTDFVKACDELLANPLYTNQWAEENGLKLFENNEIYQAFCSYHISDNDVIGLWKHSYTSISHDNGKSFSIPQKESSLVMSGQKIWGQACGENGYYLVYVPSLESTHRYPLCVVRSDDGICFKDMRLICGEVPPMRYAGFWKDFGLQYMRGIYEGLITKTDRPEDEYMYLTYSVNKEDIWFCKVPVKYQENQSKYIYKPKWCSLSSKEAKENIEIDFEDEEPVDYMKYAYVMETQKSKKLSFEVEINEAGKDFYIYIKNEKYQNAFRMIFKTDGRVLIRTTADVEILKYICNKKYRLEVELDCSLYEYGLMIFDETDEILYEGKHRFFSAVSEVSLICFQGGADRSFPDLETDPDKYRDMDSQIAERKADKLRGRIWHAKKL